MDGARRLVMRPILALAVFPTVIIGIAAASIAISHVFRTDTVVSVFTAVVWTLAFASVLPGSWFLGITGDTSVSGYIRRHLSRTLVGVLLVLLGAFVAGTLVLSVTKPHIEGLANFVVLSVDFLVFLGVLIHYRRHLRLQQR